MEDLHRHDLPATSGSEDKMEWTLELHSHRGDNARLSWKGSTEHFAVFREGFPAISSNITEQVFFLAPASNRIEVSEVRPQPLLHSTPTFLQLPPGRDQEPISNGYQNKLEGNQGVALDPISNTVIQPSYPSTPPLSFSVPSPVERLKEWAKSLVSVPPGESPYKKWAGLGIDVAAGVFIWVGLCNSPWTQNFMKSIPVIGGNGSVVQATINAVNPKPVPSTPAKVPAKAGGK